jgi:hypothetical protein
MGRALSASEKPRSDEPPSKPRGIRIFYVLLAVCILTSGVAGWLLVTSRLVPATATEIAWLLLSTVVFAAIIWNVHRSDRGSCLPLAWAILFFFIEITWILGTAIIDAFKTGANGHQCYAGGIGGACPDEATSGWALAVFMGSILLWLLAIIATHISVQPADA